MGTAAPRRFVAPTSKEALRRARSALGHGALVLASRDHPDGFEIVAIADTDTATLVEAASPVPALPPGPAPASDSVLSELHSMRSMIEERLAGVVWSDQQRRDPVRGRLLRTMLGAGFSTRLSRALLEKLPAGHSYADGLAFARSELVRAVPVQEDEDGLLGRGGVYALVGPTGVGKTTTTAKLAARCVMRFGADKLALVTTDGYRIGAYEQLRIYGQILGVPVYAVKDAAHLQVVLDELRDKHMVLVDTVGMSQRDRAVSDQIAMLCNAGRPVNRLLLLNAAAHGDTLNEVVYAYQRADRENALVGCIFTKLDEAPLHGALLDTVIRHRLPVHYLSDGQKVPENLAVMDAGPFVDAVLQSPPAGSLFTCAPLGGDVPANAAQEIERAQAQAERLRQQYQRLIRAMAHDAEEVAAAAAALQQSDVGFEAARALWTGAGDDAQAPVAAVLDELVRTASGEAAAACDSHVLAVCGRARLDPNERQETYDIESCLLASDRTGLPLAAPNQWLAMPGDARWGDRQVRWLRTMDFGKPLVTVLTRLAPLEELVALQEQRLRWVARAHAGTLVMAAADGQPTALSRLQPEFGAGEAVTCKGQAAHRAVAELQVLMTAASGTQLPLRCVFTRTVATGSGKVLQQSWLLTNVPPDVPAQRVAQWQDWAARLDGCLRLSAKGLSLLGGVGELGDPAMMHRLLVAGHVATTAWRVLQLPGERADRTRVLLAELAGRQVRADRPPSGSVVYEGLAKLFHLLAALGADTTETSRIGSPA